MALSLIFDPQSNTALDRYQSSPVILLSKEDNCFYRDSQSSTELWIDVSESNKRIVEYGLEDKIIPIKAEAHALPFAKNFFDVIVAVDSYGYFGTDDLYLSYITSFLKPEGIIAAALPGLMQDFDNFKVPEHLLKPEKNGNVFWEPDCFTFHTKDWWFSHWMKTTLVEVETNACN